MPPHNQQADLQQRIVHAESRRYFLRRCQVGLGSIALSSLLPTASHAQPDSSRLGARSPTSVARAKRVVYLHMVGAPSQLDLFDYKPELTRRNGQACPAEFLANQNFAFIKGHPQLLGSPHGFARCGDHGVAVSQLLPHIGEIVDELAIVRSMNTDQFNHAPAQLFVQTGKARFGYPSMGSWVTYGLGSDNHDLPGFVVLVSGGRLPAAGKQIWGHGFLPGIYQGVQCRTAGEPILFAENPPGMSRRVRRASLDAINDLNRLQYEEFGDPATVTRIEQFELAYRMQISVPEVMDISREPQHMLRLYGAEPGQRLFANNCLLARRLLERGVRFVQLYDWGWDEHGTGEHDDLVHQLPKKCRETDRPVAALIRDLKQRGLLEDTLVIWGGEFGRTSMMEARNGSRFLGRDHHPHAFTMFFAGGGIKPGTLFGKTDELGYFITEGKMTVRDLQATILHLLGMDPFQLSYPLQGLAARLVGPTNEARVRHEILA